MFISLIDFWKIRRHMLGENTIVRPFHHIIADNLTKLMLGQLDRPNLMILMPPRCGKTDLCTRTFIPWSLSYFPDSEYLNTSYGADLATANNISIRDTLASQWYRDLCCSTFGAVTEMRGDKAGGRQDHFYTTVNGAVKALGVGGGSLGFGCGKLRPEWGGCGVIDDPLKIDDAKSAAVRKSVIDWFPSGLESRRNRKQDPMTPIILVMQRLHPQDLAGHLLRTQRERWTVVQIPAHSINPETGIDESVWPERISMAELMQMKEATPEVYWAQYMQSPTDAATTIFKRGWWRYWTDRDKMEDRLTMKIITADTAFKATDSNDWSVLQCWGMEGSSSIVLVDQVRGRWEFPALCAQAKAFWEKHHSQTGRHHTPATEFWIEDKASGTSLVQTLRSPEVGIPARGWIPSDRTSSDKVGRANQCTMPISTGRVVLPDPKLPGYEWVEGFINEHEAFTNDDSHLYDDQVDTETEAVLIWQERGGGRGPLPAPYV